MTNNNRAAYNSNNLIKSLTEEYQYPWNEAKMIVEHIFEELSEIMEEGKDIYIYNFGLFLPKRVEGRNGKHTVARLMPVKALNDRLQEGYEMRHSCGESDEDEEETEAGNPETVSESTENSQDKLLKEIMNDISFELGQGDPEKHDDE